MNVSLTLELENYVHDKVKSGLYTSASEVIRESLRQMHHHESLQQHKIHALNQAISVGLKQLEEGKKLIASESYQRLKKKIKSIHQEKQ